MTTVQIDPPSKTSFWQTCPIFLAGLFAVITFWWFGLAGTNYHGQHPMMSFTTAGWFVLGIPFTLAMSVAFGCLVAVLARKSWFWCATAFTVVFALTGLYIYLKLPSTQVRQLFGEEAANIAKIEKLRVSDSFNDGETTSGILSGPDDLLRRITTHCELEEKRESPMYDLQRSFHEHSLPEIGTIWEDDWMRIYHDVTTGRIFFTKESRIIEE